MAAPDADVEIDASLVKALLEDQHPDLAGRPLVEVAPGWDNVIYRLGDDLTVRLPRRAMSAELVLHEQRWLPELAAGLPLPIPAPLRRGVAGRGYPWAWSIGPWFPGKPIEHRPPRDWREVATRLGEFLAALHKLAPPGAPANPYRGTPLRDRTARLEVGLEALGTTIERDLVLERWAAIVEAPAWSGPPLWLHGDLHSLNLLVNHGRLSAVIDFGDMTAGDPATDISAAWIVLPASVRHAFRAAAGGQSPVDDDTWRRAQGWALALGIAYMAGDDRIAGIGRRAVDAVLGDDD
ncbi:MAG: aminoglycoside phosphotransferase family protein [Acidimicrobiales bacterium]